MGGGKGAREFAQKVVEQVVHNPALKVGWKSRVRQGALWLAICLIASVVIQYIQKHGFEVALKDGSATLMGIAVLSSTVLSLIGSPKVLLMVANVVTVVIVARFIGIVNPVADAIVVVLAAGAAYAISHWSKIAPAEKPRPWLDIAKPVWVRVRWPVTVTLSFWFVVWVGIGVSDFVRDRIARREEPAVRQRVVDKQFADPSVRVGVALSGGGYRAALLHAGVLNLVDSLGIPIRAMSTVSGGSIIGAYFAQGGDPRRFLEVVADKRVNLARTLFHPLTFTKLIARSRYGTSDYFVLPFLGDYTRTHAQADLLDRVFFNSVKHREDSAVVAARGLELMLCMTDIVGSALIGVTPHGYLEQTVTPPSTRFTFTARTLPDLFGDYHRDEQGILPGNVSLATLVAASGAFPGAFKPVRMTLVRPHVETSPNATTGNLDTIRTRDTSRIVLADGGMADNLGLVLMYTAGHFVRSNPSELRDVSPEVRKAAKAWDVNVVIASDGSAISVPAVPASGIQELGSAIDVVYRASAGEQLAGRFTNPRATLLSPDALVDPRDVRTARLEFGHASGNDTLTFASGRGAPLSYMSLQPVDLRYLVSRMDTLPDVIAKLQRHVDNIIARNGDSARTNSRSRFALRSASDDSVYAAIMTDLDKIVSVFIETSTLKSDFSRSEAESIFRLGEYVFLLNRPFIAYSANHAPEREPALQARQIAGVVQQGQAVLASDTAKALREAILHRRQRVMKK